MPIEIGCGIPQQVNVYCGAVTVANKVYSGSNNVLPATETNLVNETLSNNFILTDLFLVGEVDGVYRLYKNAILVLEARSSSSERVIHHSFNGFSYSAGDVLRVTVEHYETGSKEFKAFVLGNE